MNSNEILNRTTNTEGNKTESSSTDNIEIDLYAKRSRLNRAESDSEIDSYRREYPKSTRRNQSMELILRSVEEDITDQTS